MPESLRILSNKLKRGLAQLPYLPRALGLVWAAAPALTVAWMVLIVVQGLLPAATVTLTRLLVDGLVGVLGKGLDWAVIRPTLVYAALIGGIMLLAELLRGLTSWIRTAQAELVQDHVAALVQRQSLILDMAFYDSPDYYDALYRARRESGYRPVAILENLGGLLQNGITLVAMAAVLIPYGVWLPIALFLSTLPAFFVVLNYTLRQHQWRHETTEAERRTWYFDWLLSARETAAELRLFRLGDYFQAGYQELRKRLREQRLKWVKDESVARLFASATALVVSAAAMAWMGWRALQGTVTLGDLALFYQAFNQGQGLMRSLLDSLSQLYSNSLFLGDLFAYLALVPQVVDPPSPRQLPVVRGEVRFEQVGFCYPGGGRQALKGLDLTIPAGQVAAIVGVNGAGKSTLIKLLCRFYDPEAGRVLLDGVDLRELSIAQVRRSVTVLFQEPVHYQETAGQNIAVGDLEVGDLTGQVRAAAQAAGADGLIEALPLGYQTILGKWFAGGTELSVGEWQRVALARAFLRQSAILVLDEPTSSMDPWAEADWLARFRRLAHGRTALIITHRFTTAAHADVIHVMHDGRIVESGSHYDLLACGGSYARSWNEQMQRWLEKPGAG